MTPHNTTSRLERRCSVNIATAQKLGNHLASDWHRLGAGLSVRFTLRGERIEAEWRPRLPTKREQRRILDRYRAARDAFLAAYGREIGGRVAVLEVAP